MVATVGFDTQVSEAQRCPFLLQIVLPIAYLQFWKAASPRPLEEKTN
jgi:hypothetical protein